MGLADIVHVEFKQHVDALDRHAGALDDALRRRAFVASLALQRRCVEPVEHQVDGLHLIVAQVGDHAAERRGEAGIARRDRRLQADFLDQRARMQRAAAAERHQREVLRDRGRARSRPAAARRPCAHWRRARSPPPRPPRPAPAARRHGRGSRACAASTSSRASLPPIGRSALMRPSTTCASVSVGRVAAGAVADRPRHASPRSPGRPAAGRRDRREAIEPPPAPMVVISIIGVRMTRPKSIVVCAASEAAPLAISETSNEVPPRSAVMTFSKPAALAIARGRDDARGRAGERGAHREFARAGDRHHAAVRLHDMELARETLRCSSAPCSRFR